MKCIELIRSVVRPYISDTKAPFAYSDAVILDVLRGGLDHLFGSAPQAFYVDDIITESPDFSHYPATSEIPVLSDYIAALGHYCAWVLLETNTEDASMLALSKSHYAEYREALS